MTNAISRNDAVLRPIMQALDIPAAPAVQLPEEMDESSLIWLGRMIPAGLDGETGKPGKKAGPEVSLRPASVTQAQAQQAVAGIVSVIQELQALLVAERSPLSTSDGIEAKASEAAGSVLGATAQRSAGVQTGPQGVHDIAGTGDDSESPAIGWMSGNRFGELLSLLRALFLEIEKMHRDNSVRDTAISRQQTINAGQAGISKAKENLFGAIGAVAISGAIGGAGLRSSGKATVSQTRSVKVNQTAGHRADVAIKESGATGRVNGHLEADAQVGKLSAQRGNSGNHGPDGLGASPTERSAIAESRVMHETADAQAPRMNTDIHRDEHSVLTTQAQQQMARASLINMMATPAGALSTSGAGINAEAYEAERQMMLHVADVFVRMGSAETEQSAKTRDQRASVDALVRDMNSLDSDTASNIIRRI